MGGHSLERGGKHACGLEGRSRESREGTWSRKSAGDEDVPRCRGKRKGWAAETPDCQGKGSGKKWKGGGGAHDVHPVNQEEGLPKSGKANYDQNAEKLGGTSGLRSRGTDARVVIAKRGMWALEKKNFRWDH